MQAKNSFDLPRQQHQQQKGQNPQQQSQDDPHQEGSGTSSMKHVTVFGRKYPFPAISIYRLMTKLIGYGADSREFHFIVFDDAVHMAAIAAKLLYPHRIGRITGKLFGVKPPRY